MKDLGTINIETDRLLLRRFTILDVDQMYNNYASNPNVTRYLSWPAHQSKDITKMIITSWVGGYANDYFYQWAIVLKEINEVIGGISVVGYDDNLDSYEIGYCIGENYWNKGITTEALNKVIEFLFKEVKVNNISAYHDTRNPNSGKVMKKCGMKYLYTIEKKCKTSLGDDCDAAYYKISKDEYFKI